MKQFLLILAISSLVLNVLAEQKHPNPVIIADIFVNEKVIIENTVISFSKDSLNFIGGTPSNSVLLRNLDDDEKPGFNLNRISNSSFESNESGNFVNFQVTDRSDKSILLNVSIRTNHPLASMIFGKLKQLQ